MTDSGMNSILRAKIMLEEACRLIESSIDGHVLQHHAKETLQKLRTIIESDSDPGSIGNMIRALEADEGHPVWTRPLDSVKYAYRKPL
jgi:hypothetical protein